MTKPLIKLPSVELREIQEAFDRISAELAEKNVFKIIHSRGQ